MKFSIRDILWLTILVAVAVAWWLDHRASVRMQQQLPVQAEQLQYQVQLERALREAVQKEVAAERQALEAQADDMASEFKAAMKKLQSQRP